MPEKTYIGKKKLRGRHNEASLQPKPVKPIALAIQDKGKWKVETLENTANFGTAEDFHKTGGSYSTSNATAKRPEFNKSKRPSQSLASSTIGTDYNT